jgi:hypothetical protein
MIKAFEVFTSYFCGYSELAVQRTKNGREGKVEMNLVFEPELSLDGADG